MSGALDPSLILRLNMTFNPTMNLACENCGSESPAGSNACIDCGEAFDFVSKPSAQWTPSDHSKWLFSQHFQIAA